jgi:hypothetical protein
MLKIPYYHEESVKPISTINFATRVGWKINWWIKRTSILESKFLIE